MGLMTTVLLLPLAPVRGVIWIGELLYGEAEQEVAAKQSPAAALDELEAKMATGEISPADAAAMEAEIIERMLGG